MHHPDTLNNAVAHLGSDRPPHRLSAILLT
ncbi:Uncharacterised protein [Vibrio cholerae]|nr:Uncharacterised protein [Vibrio cholerae]